MRDTGEVDWRTGDFIPSLQQLSASVPQIDGKDSSISWHPRTAVRCPLRSCPSASTRQEAASKTWAGWAVRSVVRAQLRGPCPPTWYVQLSCDLFPTPHSAAAVPDLCSQFWHVCLFLFCVPSPRGGSYFQFTNLWVHLSIFFLFSFRLSIPYVILPLFNIPRVVSVFLTESWQIPAFFFFNFYWYIYFKSILKKHGDI